MLTIPGLTGEDDQRQELTPRLGGALAQGDLTHLAELLVFDAVASRASDIHLDTHADGVSVRLRVDGRLRQSRRIELAAGQKLINQFKALGRLDPVTAFEPQQAGCTVGTNGQSSDLRLTVVPCVGGDKMAIRLLDAGRPTYGLDQLGLSHEQTATLTAWLDHGGGMLMVTGPTGSGKTTTLYAMLNAMRVHDRNVMTIEDPIEYEVPGINQLEVDTEHGLTFAEGVRTILRLDPDCMLVGEVRDEGSAEAAIEAAATGCNLLTTLHSRDAAGAVTVLRNLGVRRHEIAAALSVVVAQRLVPQLCAACRRPAQITDQHLALLEEAGRRPPESVFESPGCEACQHLGHTGRVGVFEVWALDDADVTAVLEDEHEHERRNRLVARGHGFLLDDILGKAGRGEISLDAVLALRATTPPGQPDQQRDSAQTPLDPQ